MKKITVLISIIIALCSAACQSATAIENIRAVAGNQAACQEEETKPQQKINETLKALESNAAGVKVAQYINENDVQVVWGDCGGGMGCASGNTIILDQKWINESPELISGIIAHETVHVMTPVEDGSSLYEEYRAFETEDQVREGYRDNAGFTLQGGYQLNNDDFTGIDPLTLSSLIAWFMETPTYWQEYVIDHQLPAYPPSMKSSPQDINQQTAADN